MTPTTQIGANQIWPPDSGLMLGFSVSSLKKRNATSNSIAEMMATNTANSRLSLNLLAIKNPANPAKAQISALVLKNHICLELSKKVKVKAIVGKGIYQSRNVEAVFFLQIVPM